MKFICIYSYSPDLGRDRTRENVFCRAHPFPVLSAVFFFHPAVFLLELKYAMAT